MAFLINMEARFSAASPGTVSITLPLQSELRETRILPFYRKHKQLESLKLDGKKQINILFKYFAQ